MSELSMFTSMPVGKPSLATSGRGGVQNNYANDQVEHLKQHKSGPPMGNRNSVKGGAFTRESKEEKKQFALLLKQLVCYGR